MVKLLSGGGQEQFGMNWGDGGVGLRRNKDECAAKTEGEGAPLRDFKRESVVIAIVEELFAICPCRDRMV